MCHMETFSTKGIQPFTCWFGCLTQFDISLSMCVCVYLVLIKSGTEGCTRESGRRDYKNIFLSFLAKCTFIDRDFMELPKKEQK